MVKVLLLLVYNWTCNCDAWKWFALNANCLRCSSFVSQSVKDWTKKMNYPYYQWVVLISLALTQAFFFYSILRSVYFFHKNCVYFNVHFFWTLFRLNFWHQGCRNMSQALEESGFVPEETDDLMIWDQRSTIGGQRTIREKEGQEPRTHRQIYECMEGSILNLIHSCVCILHHCTTLKKAKWPLHLIKVHFYISLIKTYGFLFKL